MQDADCDYIVVGSGAGGGTVAARLAEAGYRVVLLEAGGDPRQLVGGDPVEPDGNRLPDDYDVPAFHPSLLRTTGSVGIFSCVITPMTSSRRVIRLIAQRGMAAMWMVCCTRAPPA